MLLRCPCFAPQVWEVLEPRSTEFSSTLRQMERTIDSFTYKGSIPNAINQSRREKKLFLWLRWLPWAEFVYNTSFHSTLRDTPFRVVYGRDPPSIRSYDHGDCRVAAVAQTMAERDEFLADVRARLLQAQDVAKRSYDRHHRELSFQVGDWVWLRIRHRSPASLAGTSKGKLWPHFYGLYKVAEVIDRCCVFLHLKQGNDRPTCHNTSPPLEDSSSSSWDNAQ
ncbi:hypothetical protein U9M48_027839 [Paspalum notatum var. saurae]|uniref:Uncharacterized protein n=1 Tax=Paspalum notatum var. saurae TaxID=547442 RepID=A0AAQ3TVM0_PASNO